MTINGEGNLSVHKNSISLCFTQCESVHCSIQTNDLGAFSRGILSLCWSCHYIKKKVCPTSIRTSMNSLCFWLLTAHKAEIERWKDANDKGLLWLIKNKTKLNNGAKHINCWDFKLKDIKMQAVIITRFVSMKYHDLLQHSRLMLCVKALLSLQLQVQQKVHQSLGFFLCSFQETRVLDRWGSL